MFALVIGGIFCLRMYVHKHLQPHEPQESPLSICLNLVDFPWEVPTNGDPSESAKRIFVRGTTGWLLLDWLQKKTESLLRIILSLPLGLRRGHLSICNSNAIASLRYHIVRIIREALEAIVD